MSDNKNDDGPSTPIHSTGSYPVFQQTARELAEKLEKLNDPDAWLMSGELRWYAEKFGSWSPTNRPEETERKRLIDEYMVLFHKGNNKYLDSKKPKR